MVRKPSSIPWTQRHATKSTKSRRAIFAGGLVALTLFVLLGSQMLLGVLAPSTSVHSPGLRPAIPPNIVLTAPWGGPASTIGFTTTTWAAGAGSLAWPGSPTETPATGQVILDEHSTVSPGGGHYGGNAGMSGFSVPYTCSPACLGGSTVTWGWTINPGGVWWTQITMNCNGGQALAEFAVYGQVWIGTTLVSQTIVTVQVLYSTTFPTATTLTGGAIPPVVTVVPAGFANGVTYTFVSYVWTQSEAFCPTGSGGNAYSEVDVGNRGVITMPTITLS